MTANSRIEQIINNIIGRVPLGLADDVDEPDLNQVGVRGRTPLMVAAAEGNVGAVDALVRKGASVGATGDRSMSALHEASANGHTSVVGHLLNLGADVNAFTIDGVTPLMCAAAWGHLDAAKLLLENGANAGSVDRSGATAVDIAREKGEDFVADLIDTYQPRG